MRPMKPVPQIPVAMPEVAEPVVWMNLRCVACLRSPMVAAALGSECLVLYNRDRDNPQIKYAPACWRRKPLDD